MTPGNTVSGSKAIDRMIFGALLAVMLGASPRLLVYYHSTQTGMTRVELAAIDARGTRIELAVPAALRGHKVRGTIAAIEAFAKTAQARTMTPAAGRLEWTLRYSVGVGQVTTPRTRVLIMRDSPH